MVHDSTIVLIKGAVEKQKYGCVSVYLYRSNREATYFLVSIFLPNRQNASTTTTYTLNPT